MTPSRRAFTLIELMVSVFILCIVVLAIGRIVGDVNRAMETGTRQAYVDGNARALMEIIVDDLSQAITDDSGRFWFEWKKIGNTYHGDFEHDELTFTAVLGPVPTSAPLNDPSHYTQMTVKYWVENATDINGDLYFAVKRGERYGTDASVNTYPMLDYIVEFKITLYNDQGQIINDRANQTWVSCDYLPSVAAIHLTLISEDAHRKARKIAASAGIDAMRDFILKNSRHYFTAAYFPMRRGRKPVYNYHL